MTKVFFIVKGPLIWLNDKGEPDDHFDVHQHMLFAAPATKGSVPVPA